MVSKCFFNIQWFFRSLNVEFNYIYTKYLQVMPSESYAAAAAAAKEDDTFAGAGFKGPLLTDIWHWYGEGEIKSRCNCCDWSDWALCELSHKKICYLFRQTVFSKIHSR